MQGFFILGPSGAGLGYKKLAPVAQKTYLFKELYIRNLEKVGLFGYG